MTQAELMAQARKFFDENPLAQLDEIQVGIDEVYHASIAEQTPAYVPTEVNQALTVGDTFREKHEAVAYQEAKDESTYGDLGDTGLV